MCGDTNIGRVTGWFTRGPGSLGLCGGPAGHTNGLGCLSLCGGPTGYTEGLGGLSLCGGPTGYTEGLSLCVRPTERLDRFPIAMEVISEVDKVILGIPVDMWGHCL